MISPARPLLVGAVSVAMLLATGASPALARSRSTGPKTSGPTTTGNDISWPQCGRSYPSGQAFGIVGLNGGLANDLDGCLASELDWAWTSSGASKPGVMPAASLYVNTADPSPAVSDWPRDDLDPNGISEAPGQGNPNADPYGACSGGDDRACAWQYGWDRAIQDMLWLAAAQSSTRGGNVPAAYPWWLDVETGNTWETGSAGQANNIADLEGMVAAFESTGESASGVLLGGVAHVGIYSTASQWGAITGGVVPSGSDLAGLPDWIPGARTQSAATSACSASAFTGGGVIVTQWFGKPFDGDYACASW
jgi:hypothetical protein